MKNLDAALITRDSYRFTPPYCKKGNSRGGKTVTVCSKTPKNFGAFGADLTKNQWFYTSCWASTAGGGKFLSFLHRFVTILHSKTLIFQCKTQNPSTKSPKFSPAAHTHYRFTPLIPNEGKIRGVKR